MVSVIPVVVCVFLVTGVTGAVWQLWSARPAARAADLALEVGARGIRAVSRLVWAIYLLLHAVILLTFAESREVAGALSVCGSLGGGLAILGALAALTSCISLERRLSSGR